MSAYPFLTSTTQIMAGVSQDQNNFIAFDSNGYVYYLSSTTTVIKRQLIFDANRNVSSLGTSTTIALTGNPYPMTSFSDCLGICIGLSGTNTAGYIFLSRTVTGTDVYTPTGSYAGGIPLINMRFIVIDPKLSNITQTVLYSGGPTKTYSMTIYGSPPTSANIDNAIFTAYGGTSFFGFTTHVFAIGSDNVVYSSYYGNIMAWDASTQPITYYTVTPSTSRTYPTPLGIAVNSTNSLFAIYSNNGTSAAAAVDIYTITGTTAATKTLTYAKTISGASMGTTTGAGSPVIFYSGSFYCATYSGGSLNLVQLKQYSIPTNLTLTGYNLSWVDSDSGVKFTVTNSAGTTINISTTTSCDMSSSYVPPNNTMNVWYVNSMNGSTVVATSAPFYPPFPFSSTYTTLGLYTGATTNGYLTKYNPAGSVIWVARIGGAGSDCGNYTTYDKYGGNIYVTGQFTSNPLYLFNASGSGSLSLSGVGASDAFLAKYDRNGNAVWAAGIGGTSNDYGYGVESVASGNTYVIGNFSSSLFTFNNASGGTPI